MKQIITFLFAGMLLVSCRQNMQELDTDISIPVSIIELKLKPISQYVSTTGTVKPVKEVEQKAQISGIYKLLTNPATGKPYALGDMVREGTTIITLEDEEYENNIKIESLKLSLDISKQVYDKQQSLYDKGGVTLSELKNSEINYINAEYAYDDAMIRLEKMKVKAPFSGTIVDLPYYTQGTRVETGVSIIKLMDYKKMIMEINLAEKNFGNIEAGQTMLVTNYTIREDTLYGEVTQLSPAIDPDSRTFKGMVSIDNQDQLLRPGMFVKGDIIVATVDSALVIPKEIILSKERGNVAFVVDKGLADERYVRFGLENPDEVQIVDGLEKNDQVVVKGYETLRNRSKIKVVK